MNREIEKKLSKEVSPFLCWRINGEKIMDRSSEMNDEIISQIYFIHGRKVMLDSDLARIYRVETRILNQAVKRNQDRFPVDFMFQLTSDEFTNLMSQFVISRSQATENVKDPNLMSHFTTSSWGGRRKLPFVFTEHW
jgi:hypothetical protein